MRRDLLGDFPALEKYVYLNTASIGLTPKPVIRAVMEFLEGVLSEGTVYLDEEKEAMVYEVLRSTASKLFGCGVDEVAVFSSVTEALNSIAWALRGDGRILSTDVEFPTVVYPWVRVGKEKGWRVELIRAKDYLVDEDEVLSRIDRGVRAVCLSHVEFLTGQRFDLRAIAERAHEVGTLLIVDGVQAAGYIPLDVKSLDVDVYITGSYKWLIGPMGAAVAYIRRDLYEELEPGLVGWRSVKDMWSLDVSTEIQYADTARKFEYSTSAYCAKLGMAKSIEYLLRLGIDAIYDHNMKITQYLIEELENLPNVKLVTPVEQEKRGSIVTVKIVGKDIGEVAEKLTRGNGRKIVVSIRRGLLRFSPHFYNDEEDLAEAVERLTKIIKS